MRYSGLSLYQESESELDAGAAAEVNGQTVILPFETPESGAYSVKLIGEMPEKPVYSFFKRATDIALSLLGLPLGTLPMLIIAVIIKFTSDGPVFFTQERLGRGGKPFLIIKFRTMRQDAEKNGAQWSTENDDRVYPFGSFLRKTHLDELPQLLCCISGTMSIVGPRPERECFYQEFEKYIPGFYQRTMVKPGLTGYAVAAGGYWLRPEEKLKYDIEYIINRSARLDIKIFFMTLAGFFRSESKGERKI